MIAERVGEAATQAKDKAWEWLSYYTGNGQ